MLCCEHTHLPDRSTNEANESDRVLEDDRHQQLALLHVQETYGEQLAEMQAQYVCTSDQVCKYVATFEASTKRIRHTPSASADTD